jgi:TRAP-type C4-dicarboxylate transport system permease small subunit
MSTGHIIHTPSPSGELQEFEQHGVPQKSPLLKPFHAVDDWIGRLELVLLILLVAAMLVLGTLQIVMREIFNTGLTWADPLLRNMVLVVGMVGAMVATQSGRHLNMDAVARILPKGARRWVDVFVNLVAGVSCAALVWLSIQHLQIEMSGPAHEVVGSVVVWHIQLIFPISFSVMAYRFLLYCIDGLLGGQPQSHEPKIL